MISRSASAAPRAPNSSSWSSGTRPHSHSSKLPSRTAHRRVALGVTGLDNDAVLVEPDQPLAIGVGRVDVDGATVSRRTASPEGGHEHGEHLVDPVDRELRLDRADRQPDGLLGVHAVNRRLLGHPPGPEPGPLVVRRERIHRPVRIVDRAEVGDELVERHPVPVDDAVVGRHGEHPVLPRRSLHRAGPQDHAGPGVDHADVTQELGRVPPGRGGDRRRGIGRRGLTERSALPFHDPGPVERHHARSNVLAGRPKGVRT